MCSLSIVTTIEGYTVFTHNRDETVIRQLSANTLEKKIINERYAVMPIDPVSQGTWIGSNGFISAALLNGFQSPHIKKISYSKSRGTIIPTLLAFDSIDEFICKFSFKGMEPFTLIALQDQLLMEIGWDEFQLHTNVLNKETFTFYSSYTLYDQATINNRKTHMIAYLKNKKITSDLLLGYHILSGQDHNQYLNVSFTDHLKTVSLTQLILNTQPKIKYKSLLDQSTLELYI